MSSPLPPVEGFVDAIDRVGWSTRICRCATCICSTISARDRCGRNFGTSGAVIYSETAIPAPGKSRSLELHKFKQEGVTLWRLRAWR
jgi:hypothetical protein